MDKEIRAIEKKIEMALRSLKRLEKLDIKRDKVFDKCKKMGKK